MNDDQVDTILKAYFSTKHTMDDQLAAQIKRKLYEKQERRSHALLCVTQVATFFMTLFIALTLCIINQALACIFILCYGMLSCFVSLTIILIHSIKTKRKDDATI